MAAESINVLECNVFNSATYVEVLCMTANASNVHVSLTYPYPQTNHSDTVGSVQCWATNYPITT